MRVSSAVLGAAGIFFLPISCLAASRPHHHTSTHALLHHTGAPRVTHTEHAYSMLSMSSERATQIQTALIQKGYLSGEPSGSWDASSYAAMQKLQGDNGWQTKLVPDSRALIKLGLGPGSTPAALAPATPSVTASAPTVPPITEASSN